MHIYIYLNLSWKKIWLSIFIPKDNFMTKKQNDNLNIHGGPLQASSNSQASGPRDRAPSVSPALDVFVVWKKTHQNDFKKKIYTKFGKIYFMMYFMMYFTKLHKVWTAISNQDMNLVQEHPWILKQFQISWCIFIKTLGLLSSQGGLFLDLFRTQQDRNRMVATEVAKNAKSSKSGSSCEMDGDHRGEVFSKFAINHSARKFVEAKIEPQNHHGNFSMFFF